MSKRSFAEGRVRAKDKWGDAIEGGFTGFQIVPDVLVRGQATLGITSAEMMVLLNILMHWWSEDHLPHPRTDTIARRMGVHKRTIERNLERLQDLGLIERLPPEPAPNGGPAIRKIDVSKLVTKLQKLATGMRGFEELYADGVFDST